jgi:hypothetical protein
LSREGTLSFNLERHQKTQADIWIERNYLKPTDRPQSLVFGSVEAMNKFVTHNLFTGSEWYNLAKAEIIAQHGMKIAFGVLFDGGLSTAVDYVSEAAGMATDMISGGMEGVSQGVERLTEHYGEEIGDMALAALEDRVLPSLGPDEDETLDLSSLLNYAVAMLNDVSDGTFHSKMANLGYGIRENQSCKVGLMPYNQAMLKNIQGVYDSILAADTIPSLFRVYATADKPAPNPTMTPFECFQRAAAHRGHMSKDYGLSASQREAIAHIVHYSHPASMMAVNGPPGTGKTTLLQDVIASEVVRSALESEHPSRARPSIIVASSTNNQAVTNVISSLQSISDIVRWLPDPTNTQNPLKSIGMYLPSSSKIEEADNNGYLYTESFFKTGEAGAGFPSRVENPIYIAEARRQFLAHFQHYSGCDNPNIDLAVNALHHELTKLDKRLAEIINTATQIHDTYGEAINGERVYQAERAAHARHAKAERDLNQAIAWRNQWRDHVESEPLWIGLLAFLPPVRNKRRARDRHFFRGVEGLPFSFDRQNHAAIDALLNDALHERTQEAQKTRKALEEQRDALRCYEELIERYLQMCRQCLDVSDRAKAIQLLENLDKHNNDGDLSALLDKKIRFPMFITALHFWEGRWLQEAGKLFVGGERHKETGNRFGKGELNGYGVEDRWRRYAMLTPCFVTTMHTGPAFFTYYNGEKQYLFDFIDLLIVDEAGMVSPELAGPMFALSRRAIVVGDRKQIEPVWPIKPHMDYATLVHYGIYADREEAEAKADCGMQCSTGSVMQIAQRSSPVQKPPKDNYHFEQGLFLAEHRRCVDDLVTYFNKLAYGGQIVALRGPLPSGHPLQKPWHHVDVNTPASKVGSSRSNRGEAEKLAEWVDEHKERLTAYYQKDIKQIIGVITPFTAQYREIEAALEARGIQGIKGGTVHALQGAERPVVLFSTVYDAPGDFFFDRGDNMMNVAVSRAKDIFVVVGNRTILWTGKQTPSGLLAEFL